MMTTILWSFAGCLMIGFCVGYVAGYHDIFSRFRRPTPTVVQYRRGFGIGEDDEVTLSDGRVYRGSSTVWHRYPSGERAGRLTEAMLSKLAIAAQWEQEEKKA